MKNCVRTPQTRCRAAIGQVDITPPVGIYHRMWGAALHDRATGVHRPLSATLLWIEPEYGNRGQATIIISLDHCILDTIEMIGIRESVARAAGLPPNRVHVALSHTHGSGWMSRTRSSLPGGELIGPYLDGLRDTLARLAQEIGPRLEPAVVVYGTGHCTLARQRDYYDDERDRFVCGFNPSGRADDTLLVGRFSRADGTTLAVLVNYACHPTTLAWENTLISPDWVGRMRELIQTHERAPCLFLQGASGDLGPQHGFVGDPSVADRNGEQVGFAALATLAALPPAGTEFRYSGPVLSGATLGIWQHRPQSQEALSQQADWRWESVTVQLPYRHDLPTIEQTTEERDHWLAQESLARETGDEDRLRICRAQIEQRTRQLTRLNALAPGRSYPLTVDVGILGDAIWILLPGELYQVFQTTLRERLAPHPVVIGTLTNDWQPGYIPPAQVYGYGIYQEVIAATAPGCLETLIESIDRHVSALLNGGKHQPQSR